MSSTRLPGKVMEPILGRPMIERQIERLMRCRRVDQLIMATSNHPEDDVLAILCHSLGVPCFRGDLKNVLDRFYQAAKPYDPKQVVRLTGDCPLTDPNLIDDLIDHFLTSECDYACNCLDPTLPDGLDAEIFTFQALEKAWQEAFLPSHLEHVTPFIRSNPKRFKISSLKYPVNLSHYRWVVDEPEDLLLVRRIFDKLYVLNPNFGTSEILELFKQEPELARINAQFERNEGSKKSLDADLEFISRISKNE